MFLRTDLLIFGNIFNAGNRHIRRCIPHSKPGSEIKMANLAYEAYLNGYLTAKSNDSLRKKRFPKVTWRLSATFPTYNCGTERG